MAEDIFKTGVAPIDYQKMLAVKPSTDAVKIANDSFESTGQALQQIASVQEKLDKQKQDAIDAQNKKLAEAQLVSDFNNYKDGLNKVIISLETQAGRKLNDDERLRVYTTYQKQLTDGLTAVGRNDLAEQAKVIYDPKLLFSLDRGSQAVPQQVNDVGVSSNNEGWTAYVILVSIIIGVIGFTFFARNRKT